MNKSEARNRKSEIGIILVSGFCILISGCSLAPEFQKPEMNLPQNFKEQKGPVLTDLNRGNWQQAKPAENMNRGEWWKIFGDQQLDQLEAEAVNANQSLKAAAARLEQSRAMVKIARAGFFPSIGLGGNAVRSKPSGAAASAFGAPAGLDLKPYTLYSAGGAISYEADIFGRVRDSYSAAKFDSAAAEGIFKTTLLALQADVAEHYYMIRSLDAERNLLRDTIKIREEADRIMARRFAEGDVAEQDKVRTESELASARADLLSLDKRRTEIEHAMAILLGKMPAEFSLAEMPLAAMPPAIPAGLPSSLLERRPDISAALNNIAAANSRIGVARSAFFPSLNLTSTGGFESLELGDLFKWSSRTWALGSIAGNALNVPLFSGGADFANLDKTKQEYEEAAANYRQQVLAAFGEVEDNLSGQRLLADQMQQQEVAARSATRSFELAKKRYDEGEVSYFEVVNEERGSLAAERALVQLKGTRFVTTVNLIRSLGGGFDLPSPAATTIPAESKPQPLLKNQ